MRPADQRDDDELEVTPLDVRVAHRVRARQFTLGRRGRIAMAACALALAVIAPLLSLTSTRAGIAALLARPTPLPTPTANASLTIVEIATTTTDIAPSAWNALRARPLLLPTFDPGAACPAAPGRTVNQAFGPAIGDGPSYIVGMGTDGVLHATAPTPHGTGSSTWGSQFALFIIAPSYHGPVLARGHQLNGPNPLLFNGGLDQMSGFDQTTPILLTQLRMEGNPAYGAPWPTFASYLRMQAPGCYGIQLDGDTFSELVIFRVAFA